MKEKELKAEERNNLINTKLTWEIPRLYALDKGNTKGGVGDNTDEDTTYPFS